MFVYLYTLLVHCLTICGIFFSSVRYFEWMRKRFFLISIQKESLTVIPNKERLILKIPFKGTISQDFLLLVFFHASCPLHGPLDFQHASTIFLELFRKFAKTFAAQGCTNVTNDNGGKWKYI